MIDGKDQSILDILQKDGRVPNAEIARRVGMAPSAVLERIRKLEASGVILGYSARVDPKALGYGLLAFTFVNADERVGDVETGKQLAKIPEVLEVHHITGEDCYLVKVRAADTEALGKILKEKFGRIRSVRSTRTTVVLGTVKESTWTPPAGPEGSAGG